MPPEDPQKPNGRLAQFLSGLWSPDKRGKWLRQHGAPVGYCLMHLSEIERVQGQMTAQQQVLTAAALALGPYVKLTRGDLPAAATMAMESAIRAQRELTEILTWRPMASAPRDGTVIFGRFEVEKFKAKLKHPELYRVQPMLWGPGFSPTGEWITPDVFADSGFDPIGWLPLPPFRDPPPPAQKSPP